MQPVMKKEWNRQSWSVSHSMWYILNEFYVLRGRWLCCETVVVTNAKERFMNEDAHNWKRDYTRIFNCYDIIKYAGVD